MSNHHIGDPGVVGGIVSVASIITSFAAQALPVVQLIAACVAIVAGIVSTVWVLRRWNKDNHQ